MRTVALQGEPMLYRHRDPRHQLLNIGGRRLVGAMERQLPVRVLRIAAVDRENMKVDVETERGTELLTDHHAAGGDSDGSLSRRGSGAFVVPIRTG